jgi:hypothetical protein
VPGKCHFENGEYGISVHFSMNEKIFQEKITLTGILPDFVETPGSGVSDNY